MGIRLLFLLFTLNLYSSPPPTLPTKYEKIATEFAYLQLFAVTTLGAISLLPEDISNWKSEEKREANLQSLLQKHYDHIQEGPKIDNDNHLINYLGHPLSGSYFYVWGRGHGLSWQESLLLSASMSTLYWEYGWEAFAEVPSTQDLLSTPILGSIWGEASYSLYQHILYHDGTLYGSKILGDITRALINPIGESNRYLDRLFDHLNITITLDYSYLQEPNNDHYLLPPTQRPFRQSYFKLNFTFNY
jgi:hypothetical protein